MELWMQQLLRRKTANEWTLNDEEIDVPPDLVERECLCLMASMGPPRGENDQGSWMPGVFDGMTSSFVWKAENDEVHLIVADKNDGQWRLRNRAAIVELDNRQMGTILYDRSSRKAFFALYDGLDVLAYEFSVDEHMQPHTPSKGCFARDCDFCIRRDEPCECAPQMRKEINPAGQQSPTVSLVQRVRMFFSRGKGNGWSCTEVDNVTRRVRSRIFAHNEEKCHTYLEEIRNDLLREGKPSTAVTEENRSGSNSTGSQVEGQVNASSDGNHTCSFCSRRFQSAYHLRRHVEGVHLNRRMFTCEECGKSCKQKAHLLEHTRAVHFVRKKQVCTICNSTFTWRSSYNRHMRDLHGEKKETNIEKKQ